MNKIELSLLGCKYPVKDENGQVVASREITSATFLENMSGLVIGLEQRPASIVINFSEAIEIVKTKEETNG